MSNIFFRKELDSLLRVCQGREPLGINQKIYSGLINTPFLNEDLQDKIILKQTIRTLEHYLQELENPLTLATFQKLNISATLAYKYFDVLNQGLKDYDILDPLEISYFLTFGLLFTKDLKLTSEVSQFKYKKRGFLGLGGERYYKAYFQHIGDNIPLVTLSNDPKHFINSALFLWVRTKCKESLDSPIDIRSKLKLDNLNLSSIQKKRGVLYDYLINRD